MNTFATIEPAIVFKKVTYYTIRMEDEEESLFLQFVNHHTDEAFQEELALIRSWLRKIGEEIGAKEPYFRHEAFRGGDARALPPPARYLVLECKLRLYCMRVNEHVVILFSGAEKTAAVPQDCDRVRPHFLLANRLSKAIDLSIREGDIRLDPETDALIFDPDFKLAL